MTLENYGILLPGDYNFLTARYACGPYISFAAGNYKRAAKKYRKLKIKADMKNVCFRKLKNGLIKTDLMGKPNYL